MGDVPAHRSVTRPMEITFKVRLVECASCLAQAPNPKTPLSKSEMQAALAGIELWPEMKGWALLEVYDGPAGTGLAIPRFYLCPRCLPALNGEKTHG